MTKPRYWQWMIAAFALMIGFVLSISHTPQIVSKRAKLKIKETDSFLHVAVNNRYYYLAKKLNEKEFKLCFVEKNHPLEVGDKVKTTGLDLSMPADQMLCQIDDITQRVTSIFTDVHCQYSALE